MECLYLYIGSIDLNVRVRLITIISFLFDLIISMVTLLFEKKNGNLFTK